LQELRAYFLRLVVLSIALLIPTAQSALEVGKPQTLALFEEHAGVPDSPLRMAAMNGTNSGGSPEKSVLLRSCAEQNANQGLVGPVQRMAATTGSAEIKAAAPPLAASRRVCPGGHSAQQNPAPASSNQATPPAPKPEEIDILPRPAAAPAPKLAEIKFSNFTSCPIADIQQALPELAHLKAEQDQSQLSVLLYRIGAKTVEIARNTPNLVSHEVVVSEKDGFSTRAEYSFLTLQHVVGTSGRVFDEYRVDVATGAKLQTDFMEKAAESAAVGPPSLADVPPATRMMPGAQLQSPEPVSQGFVSAWLYFYPANWDEIEFRYLGQEKVDRRETLVVAFAQKPGSVHLPAVFEYNGQTYKIFMQGVAWIDPVEFRILRLRSDLLSVPAALPLYRLSLDIQFAQISIVGLPSPLWLPIEGVITTNFAGSTIRERHTYSDYHLFRAQSKIVLK